jgi:hypothetical protein
VYVRNLNLPGAKTTIQQMRTAVATLSFFLSTAALAQAPAPHVATKPTVVRQAPAAGNAVGQVLKGGTVEVIARDRDWVRVRMEGWVREADLIAADTTLRPLSAADIRSDPAGSVGKLVRWEVEAVALRSADPLRTGLQSGEQYLLALGPGAEKTLVYIAVPAAMLPNVRSLPPLAPIIVTARIRNGRSEPAGVPILDLESITRR